MWVNCGPAVGFVIAIPYRGLMALRYAEFGASPAAILTKFASNQRKVSSRKLFNHFHSRVFRVIFSLRFDGKPTNNPTGRWTFALLQPDPGSLTGPAG